MGHLEKFIPNFPRNKWQRKSNPTNYVKKILGCKLILLFRQVDCSLLKLDLYLINLFRFIEKRKTIWGSCQS